VGGLFHYFLRPAMSASGGTKQNIAFAKADVRYWPFATIRVREQSGRFQSEADIRWTAR
jgi:hypothetical protein